MPSPIISAYGLSHIGNVRADNQDAFRLCETQDDPTWQSFGSLYGIADGMGGYEHGGIASKLALETFFDTFYSGTPSKSLQNLKQGIQTANLAVYQAAQRMRVRMGTTLTAFNIVGRELYLAHIGDSRVYLIRGGESTCLTNNHTAVGELVRLGVLSPDKERTHERRSILQKSLGMELFVQPDVNNHTLHEDDYLILCTDGVWAYVEDDEFATITQQAKEPELISQRLIELALERDSDDNLSALVVHAIELPAPVTAPQTARPNLAQLILGRLMGNA